jgi:hypothetical protein
MVTTVDCQAATLPVMNDTHPSMAAKQIELLRAAGESKRFRLAMNMSHAVICMSRRAIARANPTWNDQQVKLEFVRLHYGADLAQKVWDYLEKEGKIIP